MSEDDEIVNMLVPTKIAIDIVKEKEYNTAENVTIINELTEKLQLSNDSKKELTKRLKISEE